MGIVQGILARRRARVCVAAILAFSIVLLPSKKAHAEDTDIVIVGWFDHFTYGLLNTAVGLPVALTGMIVNGIANGEKPTIELNSTGQMIKFPSANMSPGSYATGAIQHGDCCDAHEAGHGKQSGVVGPAFLPIVGLQYLISGHGDAIVESWADAWSNLGSTMVNSSPIQVQVEIRDRDGQSTQRVALNLVVMERASRVTAKTSPGDNPTSVAYKYGRVGVYIMVPTGAETPVTGAPKTGPDTIFPARVEGSVFEKDFSARWDVVAGMFSVVTDSQQRTLGVDADFTDQRVAAKFLSHVLGFGVRVGDESRVALDVVGRAQAAVEGLWFLKQSVFAEASPGVMVTAGVGVEARLHVLDYLQLFASKTRVWELGGEYVRDTETFGAESPFYFTSRRFTTKGDRPMPFFGGIKYVRETESFQDPGGRQLESTIKSLFFTFGGRL